MNAAEVVDLVPRPYEYAIAKIRKTTLGFEDHGIFSFLLDMTYGSGSCQGFGNYCLGGGFTDAVLKAILKACGVDSWEKLVGRTVYAVREPGWGGMIRGIVPLPTEAGEGFVITGNGTIESHARRES